MGKTINILVILTVLFTGCEKFMHREVDAYGKISNNEQLMSAVDGVYGQLASYYKLYDDLILKGDDLNSPLSRSDTICSRESYNISDSYSWGSLYETIVSINNIITQFDELSGLPKETAEILAEAYFLRAFCYFKLIRIYGSVPLIDNIEINYNVSSSSSLAAYQFIEKDMQTAILFLPKNNNEARVPFVTFHRGVAKAVLAEVYLNWAGFPVKDFSKYNEAASLAKEVIDSSLYFGLKLMDDYAHVWDSAHLYNEESVFSVFYSNKANYTSFLFEGCYYGTIGLLNIEYSYFLKYPLIYEVSLYFPQAEINFYNNYPRNYRKEITFFTKVFIIDRHRYSYNPVGHYVNIDSINICDFMAYRKFFYNPRLVNYDKEDDDFDTYYYIGSPRVYIYRYAHTLLTYAEAKGHLGQLDASAHEAVNMIRRRANNVNLYGSSVFDLEQGLTAEKFVDSVFWERAWEFCGEPEGRLYDLKRLEKMEELPNLRHPQEGGSPKYPISKSNYWEPKPSSDYELNPNL